MRNVRVAPALLQRWTQPLVQLSKAHADAIDLHWSSWQQPLRIRLCGLHLELSQRSMPEVSVPSQQYHVLPW